MDLTRKCILLKVQLYSVHKDVDSHHPPTLLNEQMWSISHIQNLCIVSLEESCITWLLFTSIYYCKLFVMHLCDFQSILLICRLYCFYSPYYGPLKHKVSQCSEPTCTCCLGILWLFLLSLIHSLFFYPFIRSLILSSINQYLKWLINPLINFVSLSLI